MTMIEYLDFDLRITSSPTGYRAQVLCAPAGEASDEFTLPFSNDEIEIFRLRVGRSTQGTRRMESQELSAAKTFGGKLFRAAFGGNVQSCFRSSLEQAVAQNKGLRLRLRLTDAPELADLPWEYLYNPDLNRFFGLSVETPIVRYLDLPTQIKPLAIRPPLRLLVMIASPSDYPTLAVEEEWRQLQDALAGLLRKQIVAIDRLDPPTLPALRARLRANGYHAFHFIGHGAFDENVQDGLLLMEDASGRGKAVPGQLLGALLHDERTLRLAVLNACEGGRASRTDPFAGVAQSLLQQEIPAVIAMQFPITDEAAAAFSREFYAAVAVGLPVDAALAEARKAILTDVSDVEWGKPVLYLRAADGRVFDIAGPITQPASDPRAGPQPSAQRLAELYDQALGYYYTDQWGPAIQALQEILALQPDYEDAANKLTAATRQQTLMENYTAGQHAYQAGAWAEAVHWLEAVVTLEPGYHDAGTLLAEARRRHNLAELYAEAQRVFKTSNWQAVLNIGERIAALAPDYPDPDGLVATARERLAAEGQEHRAAGAYRQGLRYLDAKMWAEAVAAFEQAEAAVPGYQQAADLAARTRQTLADQKAAAERAARAEALYRQAAQALKAGQVSEAIGHLEALEQASPGYKEAEALLTRARMTLAEQQAAAELAARAETLYRQATQALKANKLAEAISHLEALDKMAQGYRDTEKLLAQARQRLAQRVAAEQRQAQVSDAYRRANEALAARDWDTAGTLLMQVQTLEPDYRDVARKLVEAREQGALAARFSRAVAHLQAGQWAEAVGALREIVAQAPNYVDPVYGSAVGLLTQALQQKERAELPPPPARRDRPKPPDEAARPRGKPKDIPR